MLTADVHPAAPAIVDHGSIAGWVVLAVVLAIVLAGGIFLTSRR